MTDQTASPQKPSSGRNIPVAIAAGLVLASIILIAIYFGPYAIIFVLALISGVAMFELSRAFNVHSGFLNLRISNPSTYVAIGVMPLLYYGGYQWGVTGLLFILLLGFLSGFAFLLLRRDKGRSVDQMAYFCLMLLWVPFLMSFVPLMLRIPKSIPLIVCITLFTIVNDIFAFVFGSKFGKHKMAKTISPGKTWEGFAGGVGSTVLLGFILSITVLNTMVSWHVMILALACAIASVIGDLFESLIKRDLKIKDFGTIMPGHGGIMDRIDSHLIALPVGWMILAVLGYTV